MNFGASFSPRMEQAASHNIASIGLVVEGSARRRPPRRRRVTFAAAPGRNSASSESTPASLARAAIASRAAFCGLTPPPSHRFTLANETPEPLGELLLREVQARTNGAEDGRGVCICHMCYKNIALIAVLKLARLRRTVPV